MVYNVAALKEMIRIETLNIEMFQKGDRNPERVNSIVRTRRDLAALVDNGGETLPGVSVNIMSYSAAMGADTRRW